ncbi:MAG: glycosyltransferase family 4 protein [Chloroflexota bacterium]
MALRIGINAAFREAPATGSGQYLTHLVANLPNAGPSHTYRLLLPRAEAATDGSACVPGWLRGKQARKLYMEQVGVPRVAVAEQLDLLHYPYFAAPLFSRARVVVTVHDVIPLLLPAYRGSWLVRAYMALVAATTRAARLVICDSLCSQRDAVRTLGLRPERTRVVYLAAAPDLRPATAAEADAVRRRFDLPERFVFYVGGLDQRKNIGVLLQAFAQLNARHPEARLAIAGKARSASDLFPDWRGQAAKLGLHAQVRFLGHVTEAEKALLYGAATAFAFPSLYEGFGLPPLEAMACGTPVVCADSSSLPEVVGDAGLLLPPREATAWGAALLRLWEDEPLRRDLRERGLARARQFDWAKTARETVEVYECASS